MKFKKENLKSKNMDVEDWIAETLNLIDEIDVLFRLVENYPFNQNTYITNRER